MLQHKMSSTMSCVYNKWVETMTGSAKKGILSIQGRHRGCEGQPAELQGHTWITDTCNGHWDSTGKQVICQYNTREISNRSTKIM